MIQTHHVKSFGKKIAAISSAERLSDELITEILSWLPAKTLMRFRCVSKTWNSLIINSYFMKLHHERSLIFQRDLRNEARAYSIMGKKHLFRALKNSYDEKGCAVAMKEAKRARQCFRVAEEESYAAAMKEAAYCACDPDAENALCLLCYMIIFFSSVLLIYRRCR
ncbi:hypothetical protein LR48_Vigan07g044100 [Vigna angularis]|uniref:F-box domain-containing protein n=1 Tax=Phaseolus angularis TaxID=3914 RepID=A0A0L9UVY3_PHAAN|nr:hypothetical protein LR48_Vigan07g044100 [Vigna angularis]